MIFTAIELKMLSLACFTRLVQSKTRKNSTPRYCKTHGLHYFQQCPMCYLSKTLDEVEK